ncbi:LuxR C-terminal-related transcriptional regulator [Pseudomonas sp. MYb185]|uniref:LuxR C-terminal-related transcriptional regulator n=1 Tax=Pseudomonas sp. MYb185 TaxID=1848729 RepID=UPI000CFC6900|nr:LuxR C-terminal-related transcriptional regulator [Pseudomonas sp. MYb185]
MSRLAIALELPHSDGEASGELVQLVGRLVRPTWIVLDDYPRAASAELDACLEQLLERSPHILRWWVGTRRRPDWRLPRLLLQGSVRELNAQDLAFNEQELQELLILRKQDLTSSQINQLLQHNDGWPAGICLQLMGSETCDLEPHQHVGTQLIEEYIEREVLADLSPLQRQSLYLLAQIPRFTDDLCRHLLVNDGGEQILVQLVQRQLIISTRGLDGRWYRLARPLASSLRLPAVEPLVIRAHTLACQWYAQHGMVREAVEHALLAGQPETAAIYLQRYGEDQLLIGQSVAQLLCWREELPIDLFFCTPRLIFLQAWALIICTRLDEVEPCIAELSRFLPQRNAYHQQRLLAHYQVVMGVLHRQRGLRTAKKHCQEALPMLDDTGWPQKILCHQTLAQQAAAELDLSLAQNHCQEALRLAQQHQNLVFEALLSIDHLQLLMMYGECETAKSRVTHTLQRVRDADVRGPVYARLLILSGCFLTSSGDYTDARALLEEGIREAESCEDAYLLFGYLGLAQLATEDGRLEQADKLLQDAEQQMQCYQVPDVYYSGVLGFARGELHLHAGRAEQALTCFSTVRQRLETGMLMAPSGFYDLLLKTRLSQATAELALDNLKPAIASLQELLQECLQSGHLLLATQIRIRLAEALELTGENDLADEQLLGALFEAQRQQQIRPVELLQRHEEQWLDQLLLAHEDLLPLRQRLLRFDERASNSLSTMHVLSKRELMVLELIAKGYSNQQVADALFISLHTVKSHARRINARLGVERRTQAVALAKELGLID